MKVINLQQRTPEWLAWRKNKIGSSDIAPIMGVCPYRSRIDLMREKLGFGEKFINPAMQRGIDYEDQARRKAEDVLKVTFDPISIEHDRYPYFIASLDGYNKANQIILEIKIPKNKVWSLAKEGKIPDYYIYQIQWQLMISEAVLAYYFCYDPDIDEYVSMIVQPNLPLHQMMALKAKAFWDDLQEGRVEEEKTKESLYVGNQVAGYGILDKLFEAKEYIKQFQGTYDFLLNHLFETFGDSRSIENDRFEIIRTERTGGIDYKRAAEEFGVPLERYKKPITITWTIKEKK